MPYNSDGEYIYPSQKNDSKAVRPFDGDWEEPRINETGIGITGNQLNIEQVREYSGDDVFRRIKNSGEILSIMGAVVDDIIGNGIKKFEYVGRTDNAENPGVRSKENAKQFWRENQELIGDGIMDAMAMGDGYWYTKTLDEEDAESTIRSHVKNNYNFKNKEYIDAATKMMYNKVDDQLNETRDLEMVPASTVEHDIDEFGNIERFVQQIATEEYDLDPDKVIHHSYMNLDGRTYGFTPIAALFAELDMLANAKDYNGIRFDNAAVPNKVFKLPNDGPEGQNFEMVKETVKQYRKLQNKHRDLVLTGDIEIEDLNDTSDMEFSELVDKVTRILLLSWQVPPSRVGGIQGSSGATSSAMAERGYNKKIKRMQTKYETILNRELFEPMFSVRITFEDPDTKEEIRRAERDLRKTEVVKQQLSLGLMNKTDAMQYLDKTRGDIMDLTDEEMREAAIQAGSSQEDMGDDTSTSSEPAEATVNQQMTPNSNGGDVINQ